MPTVVTTKHRFVGSVRVAVISVEGARLECGIPTAIRFTAPRVNFEGAHYVAQAVGDSLTLGYRILVHPIYAALLHSHQSVASIDKAAHPIAAAVNLGRYLAAQKRRAQVVRGYSILDLATAQAISVVVLLHRHETGEGLLSGCIVRECLTDIVCHVAGGVVTEAIPLIIRIADVDVAALSGAAALDLTAPTEAMGHVSPYVIFKAQ